MKPKTINLKKRIARICAAATLFFIGCVAGESPGCGCPQPPPGEDCDRCCRPEVDAGEDQAASVGQTVVLRSYVRLPPEDEAVCMYEKEALAYQWEQLTGPSADLQDSDMKDSFFVPNEAGEYVFRFRATHPLTEINKKKPKISEWDSVSVLVSATVCSPPVAEAGENQTLSGTPAVAALRGSRSHTTIQPGCEHLQLESFLWTVVSQPPGANVEIANSTRAEASADLTIPGEYEFQLEVHDDGGATGRTNIDANTVRITLLQSPVCDASLIVTVIDSRNSVPVEGSHVTVADSDGVSHTADTNASGVASFDSLAPGPRQHITVVSDETVPALAGTPDLDRPRFETTTVLDSCSSEITVPLRLTASGESVLPMGTVSAKVPASVFNMLPHSWKCVGECESDDDCYDLYYCELEDSRCKNLCTPRSILPFFSLGDVNISGQFRFAWLVPAFEPESNSGPSIEDLFTAEFGGGIVIPRNLATDDTFLNGLGPSLGREVWLEPCTPPEDCSDGEDQKCDQDPQGDYRCKDLSPLQNIKLEVHAGQGRNVFLVSGIIDVDMMEFLVPFLQAQDVWGGPEVEANLLVFLGSYRVQTLHVCPLKVDVVEGQDTDITQTLAGIRGEDCWNVKYSQKDSVVALNDPQHSHDSCDTDADCDWPNTGEKCLDNPANHGSKICILPLFKVEVFPEEKTKIVPRNGAFDPEDDRSDERLCSWLPETAPYEQLCAEHYDPEIYTPCDPPKMHDLEVPDDAECSFAYGLTVMAMDFPEGHSALPDGGRVVVGFDIHRTPGHTREPEFLVPSFQANALEGASITVLQSYLRKAEPIPDGRYQAMGGHLFATSSLGSIPGELDMPCFLAPPVESSVVDAGFDVSVYFVPENPTIWPNPVLTRVYSVANAMGLPVWSVNDLPESLTVSADPDSNMAGVVLSRVDRIDVQIEEWQWEGELVLADPLWRIYAPAGTTSFSLPPEFNPFTNGNEVWVAPWAASFSTPFEYDLFLPDQILGRMSSCSQDSYAVVAP